jgi:hypothetical protein
MTYDEKTVYTTDTVYSETDSSFEEGPEVEFSVLVGLPEFTVGETAKVNDPTSSYDGQIGTISYVYRSYLVKFESGEVTLSPESLDRVDG